MSKKIPLYIVALLFTIFTQETKAQKVTTCGYIIPPHKTTLQSNFKSVYEATTVVNTMKDVIQYQANFKLKEQNGIQNAYATMQGGQRWIVYDNTFLEDIDAYAKTKWASISIMAHEMGHHYYEHVVNGQGSTVPTEIEADAFSGYVMQKEGATLEQALD